MVPQWEPHSQYVRRLSDHCNSLFLICSSIRQHSCWLYIQQNKWETHMPPLFIHCAYSSMVILHPNLTHNRVLIQRTFTSKEQQHLHDLCQVPTLCKYINQTWEWENQQAARSTHLYCCVLRSRHHDAEDWVEDDAGDWTAVATQCIPFWGSWDPLFRVTFLTYGPTQGDLLLGFIQFGFQFHYLSGACRFR